MLHFYLESLAWAPGQGLPWPTAGLPPGQGLPWLAGPRGSNKYILLTVETSTTFSDHPVSVVGLWQVLYVLR